MRDRDDITRVVKAHADTVARVCTLYFGSRPEREDAFQDTFLRYAQSDKDFADDEHCKAWLITVAKNACKDMLKKSEAKAVLTDRFEDTASPHWQPGIETSGRSEELADAMRQLDERYRIVLYLKYYEGYSAAEIAEMTGAAENTVYSQLARGREKLKEVLADGR